jgi:hypothetical protein
MNTSQVIGGIVCLALAALLEILALVLPTNKVWFTITLGGINISIIAVILVLVGLVMLVAPKRKKKAG